MGHQKAISLPDMLASIIDGMYQRLTEIRTALEAGHTALAQEHLAEIIGGLEDMRAHRSIRRDLDINADL